MIDFAKKYYQPPNLITFVTKKDAQNAAYKYGFFKIEACQARNRFFTFWILKDVYDNVACIPNREKLKKQVRRLTRKQLKDFCNREGIDRLLAELNITDSVERVQIKCFLRFDKEWSYLPNSLQEKLYI